MQGRQESLGGDGRTRKSAAGRAAAAVRAWASCPTKAASSACRGTSTGPAMALRQPEDAALFKSHALPLTNVSEPASKAIRATACGDQLLPGPELFSERRILALAALKARQAIAVHSC